MRHVALLSGLLFSTVATAAPCPTVMIILDTSGSMDLMPDNNFGSPSKLDLAKQAIQTLMMKYGDRIPFGFTTFSGDMCTIGPGDNVNIQVEPMHGTAATIVAAANATTANGGTNTLVAIQKVSQDPKMHDPSRPSSYILLITDGEPTCTGDPGSTVTQIMNAASASMPVKSFIVGFGALPSADQMAMDAMATAGQTPCMDATLCNGHKFYAADNGAALNAAIDAISQQIAGEFGGVCDDSCYSNGCPNGGEVCFGGKCVPDPCATVKDTCPPGDYCYTTGSTPGTCVKPCANPCPSGQQCNTQGNCVADPCANVTCQAGQACSNGQCVADNCTSMGCPVGLLCYQGSCVDDPCRYVSTGDGTGCPMGTQCVAGTGACVGGLTNGMGMNGGRPRGKGCELGGGGASRELIAAALLLATAFVLRLRRRRSSQGD
jgi:hypothetical protein